MELLTICDRQIPVVPQRHARLRHLLTEDDFRKIMSKDYAAESYRVLAILIPALLPKNNPNGVPEWEWEGFTTREGWEKYKDGDSSAYDEEKDPSPTTAEIVAAFEMALMVSGANRLGKILGLVNSGATLVGAQQTGNSPTSPGGNGASPSPSTGTSVPT